jgi:hypothetical protein
LVSEIPEGIFERKRLTGSRVRLFVASADLFSPGTVHLSILVHTRDESLG